MSRLCFCRGGRGLLDSIAVLLVSARTGTQVSAGTGTQGFTCPRWVLHFELYPQLPVRNAWGQPCFLYQVIPSWPHAFWSSPHSLEAGPVITDFRLKRVSWELSDLAKVTEVQSPELWLVWTLECSFPVALTDFQCSCFIMWGYENSCCKLKMVQSACVVIE